MADNLNEANKNAENLRQTLGDILFEQRSLADEARKFTKEVFDSNLQGQSAAKAFRDIANSTRDINREMGDILAGEKAYDDLQKDITKQKTAQKALEVEAIQALTQMGYGYDSINSALNEQGGIWKLIESSSVDLTTAQFDLAELYARQLDSLADQNIEMEELANRAKTIEDGLGVGGKLAGGFDEVLNKMGGGKFSKLLNIDGAVADARKLSATLTEGGTKALGPLGKSQVAGKLFSTIGKSISKAFGPIALIVELLKGIQRADEETTKLGKSMSMTKGESALFRENLAEAARDSGNMAVTGTKLTENFNALNQQLGFINNFNTDSLVTMTKLTEQVKLSKEAAGGLVTLSEARVTNPPAASLLNLTCSVKLSKEAAGGLVTLSEARGKNAEVEYKAALGASYELQRQSGIQQDLKVILEGVSKISGQLRANLGANTVEMAKAVTLAGELGGELSDVQTISKSILNFESSIASELEAELLTGKELNLEKARQAALTGDIVGLEREIADQLGSFTEFSKMNVIQQEAMAAAFGLSSDKLSDMLFKQQVMGRNAKELRAAGEDDLARMLEQQSMSEKMSQTIEKLQSVFTDIGTAFMPVIEVLGIALSIVGLLVGAITDLLALFKGDTDFSATMGSAKSLANQFTSFGMGSGGTASSEGSRPGQSKSGMSSGGSSRTDELLEKLLAKDNNLYMNDSKLNDAINTSGVSYALGS